MVSPRVVRLVEERGLAASRVGAASRRTSRTQIALRGRRVRQSQSGADRSGQPGRDRAAAEAFPVPSAGAAGARCGFPRRHRAGADRPPDAVERERGRVRLQPRRSAAWQPRASPPMIAAAHAQGWRWPMSQALSALPSGSAIAICTDIADAGAGRIKVFEQKARGASRRGAAEPRRCRRSLAVAAVAALVARSVAALYRRQPQCAGGRARRGRSRQRRAAHPLRRRRRRPLARWRRWSGANTRRRRA